MALRLGGETGLEAVAPERATVAPSLSNHAHKRSLGAPFQRPGPAQR